MKLVEIAKCADKIVGCGRVGGEVIGHRVGRAVVVGARLLLLLTVVFVDVYAIVLAGEDDRSVVHEAHIETLRVFYFRLESRYDFAVLREHRQVKVVVIVGDQHFAVRVDSHPYRVVGDAFAAYLSQKFALVVENLKENHLKFICLF